MQHKSYAPGQTFMSRFFCALHNFSLFGDSCIFSDMIRFAVKFAFVCLFAMLSSLGVAHANSKYAGYVIHADTRKVLYQENSNELRHPASLTKVMTLYMVFREIDSGRLKLTDRIKFSKYAAGRPPSKLNVGTGNSITVEQAILALTTKSANDVATAVAEKLAGSEPKFARNMTTVARQIGLTRTTFKNASGLTARGQLTTAKDMAMMARAMMKHYPYYYRYFSTRAFTYKGRNYRNHNKLLKSYDGTDGVKTGYTNAAGFNLVASAVRKGHRVIAVVMGGRSGNSRNAHMEDLLNRAFAKLQPRSTFAVSSANPPKHVSMPTAYRVAAAQSPRIVVAGVPLPRPRIVAMGSAPSIESLISSATRQAVPRDWSLQVGAFTTREKAELMAHKAMTTTKSSGIVRIARIESPEGVRLYRARLEGLDQETAGSACSDLRKIGLGCRLIPPVTKS